MIGNVIVAGLLLLDPTAKPGEPESRTEQHGRQVGVVLENSQIVLTGTGLSGTSDGYRMKRPCWYEPYKDAADMLELQKSSKPSWGPTEWQQYADFIEPFKAKAGEKGLWWVLSSNNADPNVLACQRQMQSFVFVPPDTTPEGGITAQELADLARAALTVPKSKIGISPDAKNYVNLATWVWLDAAGQDTRSVTATLPGVMSATVTATRASIEIDPGAPDGRYRVEKNCGPTGTPYAKTEKFTCGVTYLRASVDQPRGVYQLTVTSVWDVNGQGQGQAAQMPFPYVPIRVSATRDVEVGEVQSTVRTGTR